MRVDLHFWWQIVLAAARATWVDLESKRHFWLLLIAAFCGVAALRAYRAPDRKRWAAICNQWASEFRDVFTVTFFVGVIVFAYELMWNQPNIRFRQTFEDSLPTLFHSASSMSLSSNGRSPICVQFLLPQGFQGGSYKLPYEPVPPSPPTLYNNDSALRKGIDYTVSDSTIMVNFKPATKDFLWVMYTTDNSFLIGLPQSNNGASGVVIPQPPDTVVR
jgi:hypothetical protein